MANPEVWTRSGSGGGLRGHSDASPDWGKEERVLLGNCQQSQEMGGSGIGSGSEISVIA
jgi:hypothetical protein